MRRKKNIIIQIVLLISLVGCDSILDVEPKDQLTEGNAFITYDNFKTFSWGFYETFIAYDREPQYEMMKDVDADLMQYGTWFTGSDYIWGNLRVPSSSVHWSQPYEKIRRANIMLSNIDGSEMTEDEKNHWRSVGLFFRSYDYISLLSMYGGVPWVEDNITDADVEILLGPRSSRDEVATNILRDLIWAEEHIKPNGDGENTINQNVVNALISRFGLVEGTWRKYHELGDQDRYIDASITASQKLMSAYPVIHPHFDELFNSESLDNKAGVILYKRYVEDELHTLMATAFRASNASWDITRKGIDKFLTKDGKTIWNSDLFGGYTDKYAEFRNRDNRLLYTTPPPYKITQTGAQSWVHTGDEVDREYFTVMEVISNPSLKTLPDLNWNGNVVSGVPNFDAHVFNRTKATGYRIWKHYNQLNTGRSSADFADAPIFRMGEILLNYAEAKYEVGEFDQSVANVTINKLRDRGDVDHMIIQEIGSGFDPTRDPDVDPLLWEIRRERAVELMGEGFRREDLRRWKKMNYASEIKLGRWIIQSDFSSSINIQNNASEGFVQFVNGIPPMFPVEHYLFPIPSDQLTLNPNLEQNPGWN